VNGPVDNGTISTRPNHSYCARDTRVAEPTIVRHVNDVVVSPQHFVRTATLLRRYERARPTRAPIYASRSHTSVRVVPPTRRLAGRARARTRQIKKTTVPNHYIVGVVRDARCLGDLGQSWPRAQRNTRRRKQNDSSCRPSVHTYTHTCPYDYVGAVTVTFVRKSFYCLLAVLATTTAPRADNLITRGKQ